MTETSGLQRHPHVPPGPSQQVCLWGALWGYLEAIGPSAPVPAQVPAAQVLADPEAERGERGPQQEGAAGGQARTVGQERDLVSVETQVWHVTIAVPFQQILKSQRECR